MPMDSSRNDISLINSRTSMRSSGHLRHGGGTQVSSSGFARTVRSRNDENSQINDRLDSERLEKSFNQQRPESSGMPKLVASASQKKDDDFHKSAKSVYRVGKVFLFSGQLCLITLFIYLFSFIPLTIIGFSALCFHAFQLLTFNHRQSVIFLSILIDVLQLVASIVFASNFFRDEITNADDGVSPNGGVLLLYPYLGLPAASLVWSLLFLVKKCRARKTAMIDSFILSSPCSSKPFPSYSNCFQCGSKKFIDSQINNTMHKRHNNNNNNLGFSGRHNEFSTKDEFLVLTQSGLPKNSEVDDSSFVVSPLKFPSPLMFQSPTGKACLEGRAHLWYHTGPGFNSRFMQPPCRRHTCCSLAIDDGDDNSNFCLQVESANRCSSSGSFTIEIMDEMQDEMQAENQTDSNQQDCRSEHHDIVILVEDNRENSPVPSSPVPSSPVPSSPVPSSPVPSSPLLGPFCVVRAVSLRLGGEDTDKQALSPGDQILWDKSQGPLLPMDNITVLNEAVSFTTPKPSYYEGDEFYLEPNDTRNNFMSNRASRPEQGMFIEYKCRAYWSFGGSKQPQFFSPLSQSRSLNRKSLKSNGYHPLLTSCHPRVEKAREKK